MLQSGIKIYDFISAAVTALVFQPMKAVEPAIN
jgi:hypothetical protein